MMKISKKGKQIFTDEVNKIANDFGVPILPYNKVHHAISNTSLHNKLDGSQYVGWLLNQAQNNDKNVLYFEDCYGGHWKLQKLKK